MAMCFTSKGDSLLNKRNMVAPFFAGFINIALYFFATVGLFAFGALQTAESSVWVAGAISLPGDLIQGCGSVMTFFIVAYALDRLKFKQGFKPRSRV
jgi:hypothetical protein